MEYEFGYLNLMVGKQLLFSGRSLIANNYPTFDITTLKLLLKSFTAILFFSLSVLQCKG